MSSKEGSSQVLGLGCTGLEEDSTGLEQDGTGFEEEEKRPDKSTDNVRVDASMGEDVFPQLSKLLILNVDLG